MRTSIAIVAAALSLALAPLAGAQDPEKVKVGSKPPEGLADHIEWVKGEPITGFSAEKVYVVEFWATWCPPCKKSIPHLTSLQRDLGPRGLEIIGVTDEPFDLVKKFVAEKGSSMDYKVCAVKKDDKELHAKWILGSGQTGIPVAFVIGRKGTIVHIGHPMDPEFDRILRLTLANRYDPELNSRVEPTISAARSAAKRRNYKEATGLYAKAIAEDPVVLLDYSFECWRMLGEQAKDKSQADAYIRSTIDGIKGDRYALMDTAVYLSSDPSLKTPDLDAAKYAATLLKGMSGVKEDPDALAALAAVSAAGGDYSGAAEMQYDAWMAAVPSAKPALKRTLETYESKAKSAPGAAAK